jgi:hypothetical protein
MSGIVWLASYPKSGNTWMRALLANLFLKAEAGADINRLSRDGIATSRRMFDHLTLLDSGLLTETEIDLLRPAVHRAWGGSLAADGAMLPPSDRPLALRRFVKCHDAYTRLSDGTPLLGGGEAASWAILIVRDPRDIAPSFADHRGCSVDEAIALMDDPEAVQGRSIRGQRHQLRQRLLDWSGHASSWLDQKDIPVHLVRYEAMQEDPAATFAAALRFAGVDTDAEAIERAVRLSSFESLRGQEEARGFDEARVGKNFFRRGIAGGWRGALTAAQASRIERRHGAMMLRLGYSASA